MAKANENNFKIVEGITYKKCTVCDEWFELDGNNFYKNNIKKTGKIYYHPYCKTCEKIKNAKYTRNNPDKKKIYMYKDFEKPERQIYLKELSNKRRESGEYLKWQQNNPDKIKEYGERYSNKKHTISLKEWESCKDYFKNGQDKWSCAYCGITEEYHKEK